jgi:proteasome lid subunit RPN8/RPN11
LEGTAGQVERVVPIRNAAHSRTRFRMDPEEQVQALLFMEEKGVELLAIYHSHPEGPSGLSAIDVAEWAYPEAAQVVLSSPEKGWSARTFRLEGRAAVEIELQIAKGTTGR